MTISTRPVLRDLFLLGDRRIEVYFYTSNVPKFLHAFTVFARSGLTLKHFKSKADPYIEDYSAGKDLLLTRAIKEIISLIGKQSVLFVEDTSLRIDALSKDDSDFPGLAVKEWFAKISFEELDTELKKIDRGRIATIKSDIALHLPGLSRPLFFRGSVAGVVADSSPDFPENTQYPWLTPTTFNGWFIPNGTERRLGEMSLEESWKYDFRTQALEQLINRLEEYAAVLNLPSHAYSRPRQLSTSSQLGLFTETKPIFVIVGKTCAGKSTFGERAQQHGLLWVEASQILRTFRSQYDDAPEDDLSFAKHVLDTRGQDIVARRIIELYADRLTDGIVITGFRTIEELEAIRLAVPNAQVIVIEASERLRFQRHLARGRAGSMRNLQAFRTQDISQWSFGLLRVAEDFADVRVTNENTIEDYKQQVDYLLSPESNKAPSGVSSRINPRHGLEEHQLYRCLSALQTAGRPLSCDEIQTATGQTGPEILHNNANKVLRRVPELARRYEASGQRVRYDITSAGRTYLRYMAAHFQNTPDTGNLKKS